MNQRIEDLKEQLFSQKREISLERALLYTKSYEKTEGEPTVIRRAKASAHILDNVEISIRPGELILGNRTIKPRSGIVSPEMDPYWIYDELDTIHSRPQDRFYIGEKDKKVYREQLYPYWKGKSMKDFINSRISGSIREAVDKNVIALNQTDKGQGHIIMDFPFVLRNGLQYIIDEVDKKIHENDSNDFYKAAFIVLKAVQRHILRYAELAQKSAFQEKDTQRKKEFLEAARISKRISSEKPSSFYEACQLLWYISIAAQYESNASSLSLGRFDQYMYDFYKKDVERGVPKEFLKELLECLWIKTNDVVLVRSENSAKYFAGFPTGYTIALGGLTYNGRSAVNELSYLCLESYHDIKLPQPNLAVRLNELIPRRFLNLTCETIRLGTGIPQIFNDEVIVPGFLNRGVRLEDARDYAVVGCVELSIPGSTYGLHDIALFNFLKIMEISLRENRKKENITFDSIIDDIKSKIVHYVKLVAEGSNIVDIGHREFAPVPLLSSLIDNCIEKGKDITEGGARYNFSGVQGIGEANLSDSLYALKKIVFEEKKLSFSELVEALDADFEGKDYPELREVLINNYDKYGNDNDEVDFISSDILRYYAEELEKYSNPRGGKFIPGAYTVSAHIPLGEAVGATPDGRKAYSQLADGGLSPMVGRDLLGPTAVLKSVSKLDNYLTTNGSLLNVKFSPKALAGEGGIKKFGDFLLSFMKLKIQHIQFNIMSRETLMDAQKNPENYKGLVVRVAGYSAFFIELNKKIQDDIIARTEHAL
ncbi:MAG: formate C-acetyltransferase [Clostridium sp.]|jgi:formate C-acetyltransferase|uniref:formate C-acetyltransferase n=1 Tax=Clostridium sp. TaxID=1506 RepID=UPI0025C21ED7|nr:formate C-acetyltransferase [Clostridium sp.]MCH3964949.1 formate C-acetyltransferase [Clostridium sp.]MCI1716557.1 formate C-acetyltransferase [Clostridium sp.]MCI1800961.1 formate C-acetyltransferase [Clostridium sp.]MCI1814734.1 formate C-acetyltransferase [Clostridium sp.]MCI1871708.1 formate C-acetyltransferase [Clostridium sp.]